MDFFIYKIIRESINRDGLVTLTLSRDDDQSYIRVCHRNFSFGSALEIII